MDKRNTSDIEDLKLLIEKYQQLVETRSDDLESEEYIEILKTIGEILKELKYLEDIDPKKLEPITKKYLETLTRYNEKYSIDVNKKLDEINQTINEGFFTRNGVIFEDVPEPSLHFGESKEIVDLSIQMDNLLYLMNQLTLSILKEINQLQIKRQDIVTAQKNQTLPVTVVQRRDILTWIAFFLGKIFDLFTKPKEASLDETRVVAESQYVEVTKHSERERLRKDLAYDSKKQYEVGSITESEAIRLIASLKKKDPTGYIEEVFRESEMLYAGKINDLKFIVSNDFNKNDKIKVDTIICLEDKYFRISEFYDHIEYTECDFKRSLIIRIPRITKETYSKYTPSIKSYDYEKKVETICEEKKAKCRIKITSDYVIRVVLDRQFESKVAYINGEKPNKITTKGINEKDEHIDNPSIGIYNKILEECKETSSGTLVEVSGKTLDAIKKSILGVIPKEIFDIYNMICPDCANMIETYCKEQQNLERLNTQEEIKGE